MVEMVKVGIASSVEGDAERSGRAVHGLGGRGVRGEEGILGEGGGIRNSPCLAEAGEVWLE